MLIREFHAQDLSPVVELSLRAWAPVFESIEQSMEPAVYRHFFPDWRQDQSAAVSTVCQDPQAKVWVYETEGNVGGFVAVYRRDATYGEIYMIAVDPRLQRRSIARDLTEHALNWLRDQGVAVAMVETGADPGHAPARRLYESAGFRLWPVARYFMNLKDA